LGDEKEEVKDRQVKSPGPKGKPLGPGLFLAVF
jgi:hypothetical protein